MPHLSRGITQDRSSDQYPLTEVKTMFKSFKNRFYTWSKKSKKDKTMRKSKRIGTNEHVSTPAGTHWVLEVRPVVPVHSTAKTLYIKYTDIEYTDYVTARATFFRIACNRDYNQSIFYDRRQSLNADLVRADGQPYTALATDGECEVTMGRVSSAKEQIYLTPWSKLPNFSNISYSKHSDYRKAYFHSLEIGSRQKVKFNSQKAVERFEKAYETYKTDSLTKLMFSCGELDLKLDLRKKPRTQRTDIRSTDSMQQMAKTVNYIAWKESPYPKQKAAFFLDDSFAYFEDEHALKGLEQAMAVRKQVNEFETNEKRIVKEPPSIFATEDDLLIPLDDVQDWVFSSDDGSLLIISERGVDSILLPAGQEAFIEAYETRKAFNEQEKGAIKQALDNLSAALKDKGFIS